MGTFQRIVPPRNLQQPAGSPGSAQCQVQADRRAGCLSAHPTWCPRCLWYPLSSRPTATKGHQRTPKDWCPVLFPCPSPPRALCKTLTPLGTAGTFAGLWMPCENALRALVPPQTPPGSTGGSFPRGAEQPCSTLRHGTHRAPCTPHMHRTHRAPHTHHMLVLRSHPEGRTQTPFVAFPSY